ncbi:MAG: acyltransferase domain-containing protein [Defluviitaleaceae bacterium]|nr:acyltransferase domain-containing protein [Defluviitaleaceae bacterium]
MKSLTDYLTNTALKEGIASVKERILNTPGLKSISDTLMHALYNQKDQQSFWDVYNVNKILLENELGQLIDCFIAAVFDINFYRLQSIYSSRNIPEEILAETMTDFDIWAEKYFTENNRVGAREYGWLLAHMKGEIFKLGRLQYKVNVTLDNEFRVFKNHDKIIIVPRDGLNVNNNGLVAKDTGDFTTTTLETDTYIEANIVDEKGSILPQTTCFSTREYDLVLSEHDHVLDVHIPACGPISQDDCKASMEKAISFAKKYFPEIDYKAFIVDSWLLSDELIEILSPDSNIVRFSKMFTRIGGYGGDHPLIYKWIFGYEKDKAEWEHHEAITSLQKGAHKLLADGRWFIERKGFILIK